MTAVGYAAAPVIPAPRRADRVDVPVVDREHLQALAAGDEAVWQTTVRRYERLLRSSGPSSTPPSRHRSRSTSPH